MRISPRNAETTSSCLPREPLVWIFLCLAAGIAADRFLGLTLHRLLLIGMGLLALWLASWCARWRYSSVCLLLAVTGVGATWHHAYFSVFSAADLGFRADGTPQPICLRGVVLTTPHFVAGKPDPLDSLPPRDATSFLLRVTELRNGHAWCPAAGRCQLWLADQMPTLTVGDQIQVFGRAHRAAEQMNPGGRRGFERDRARRQLCRLDATFADGITIESSASWWDPRWLLQRLHGRCRDLLFKFQGETAGPLATAVILGDRQYLDQSRIESFFVTGTIHLLAISGLHVGILATGLILITRAVHMPTRAGLWTVMLLTVGYAMLAGGRAPVVRAAILVCVLCLRRLLHRRSFSFNSLATAGIIVLAIHPTQLFNVGAQLSFLAVMALIWILPELQQERKPDPLRQLLLRSQPNWRFQLSRMTTHLRRMAIASFVIWGITLPIVAYRFHLVSPVGLVLNLFLWIPLAIGLYAGFATLLVSWIPPLALVTGAACWGSLMLMEWCVQTANQVPGNHLWVAGPALSLVLLFYAVVAACALHPRLRRRWPTCLTTAAALFAAGWLLTPLLTAGEDDQVHATFLSLGHGTCVVLELPDDSVWLYDAGCLGRARYAVGEISSFLWSRGIRRLDGIVISHADTDHFNATPGLVDRFEIETVCVTAAMLKQQSDAVRIFRESCQQANIDLQLVGAGDVIHANEGVALDVLHPDVQADYGEDNPNSIVLSITAHGRRLLLPGDLEGDALTELIESPAHDCDLILAPHHGSRHSQPEAFCQWSTPEWIVICGNTARSADTSFHKSGGRVLETRDLGAVTAVINKQSMQVTDWLATKQPLAAAR